jgi:VWFA-related protein
VIFLDDYHVRLGNSLRVRQDLAKWVGQLAPRDMVAIMYPLLPPAAVTFSRNHDGTAGELMAFQGRKYDYAPKNAIEAQYQMMTPDVQEAIRNEATMSALENLCVYLGTLRDGRKTILFVSEGMSSRLPAGIRARGTVVPMQTTGTQNLAATSDLYTSLRDVFVQANRSNTAIYTLDPRGLAPSEFNIDENVDPNNDRDILAEASDTLRSIAGETDGRAMVGRNNPFDGLQQMRRDLSAYYLLSYTSSLAPRDGKFHAIDVRVKRRNVELRARKGYWAFSLEDIERASAPPKPPPPRDVVEALENLAATVEPAARRPVVLYLGATRGTGDNARVTFAWESTQGTGTPADQAPERVNVVIHSIYGNELFKGPVPKGEAMGQPGGAITFDAPAGAVRVQTVVENARGSRLDSDTVTIDVPDFKTGDLATSTPLIFRGRTARDLQQLRTAAAPVPTAARAFARAERILVRFDAFGPPGTPLTVTVKILNNLGNSLADLPPPVKTPAGPYESEFGLGAFPPNDYLFEITVSGGGKTARTLLPIRVTG